MLLNTVDLVLCMLTSIYKVEEKRVYNLIQKMYYQRTNLIKNLRLRELKMNIHVFDLWWLYSAKYMYNIDAEI